MPNSSNASIVPASLISQKIYFIRNSRVMLDSDLAKLYGVTTSNLNKAVQRNRNRFPKDFMFSLAPSEVRALTFQSGISNKSGRGGRRYAPSVFTEQGVAMLSSVLHGARAVEVNIAIMRVFVRLRELLSSHEELRRKIEALEKRCDVRFQSVFVAIRQMLDTPVPNKRQIGFHARPSLVSPPKPHSGASASN